MRRAGVPSVVTWLALAITLYGALLRLDAFVGKYGTLDRPAWARIATHNVAPVAKWLQPSAMRWSRVATPYVGGDPINYLAFAREMSSFYQPHVREPIFLALTRVSLWALDGQDAGVSLASAIGSTIAIFATYLFGAALISPVAGLIGAAVMAVELEAIMWAPDGWRDDTFTATVLLAGWAMLRLRRQPSFLNAVLTGVFCGLACLTRITAFTFIFPGLVWLVIDGPWSDVKLRARQAALALGIAALIVAPYLISCAIGAGDPLLAINYHTSFYRYAEGQSIAEPMSASQYLRGKFASHPIATLDTGLNGLFVQPFVTKWRGVNVWINGSSTVLEWLALAGLASWPFFAAGRLAAVLLLTSLLPYIFTWNLGGGGEWRFTMHAYPFYLVAAGTAVVGISRLSKSLFVTRQMPARDVLIRTGIRVAAIALVVVLGTVMYFVLPWYVIGEAIARNESTSVETGARDRAFYRSGWSPPHEDGIIVRVSRTDRPVIRVPLAAKRDYEIILRIDPVEPNTQERVNVLFNRHYVGAFRLEWNPVRVGTYRIHVDADIVTAGSNEIIIIPETMVAARNAGPRFAWLDPDDRIGVRLWYVRVVP
jgi:hypothetical protein